MNAQPHAEIPFAAYVAIDWADRRHAWSLYEVGSGAVEQGEIDHTPEAIDAWACRLAHRFGGRPVAVALEQSRGALLSMLAKYAHLRLYPVPPAMLARYRTAFYPSRAKDDPSDAALLLELLRTHRDRLRPLEPDTVPTRTLHFLVEQRRKLVDEKTRQANRLTALLKLYFPQPLGWFDEVDSELVGHLLERWPTLQALQKARPTTLDRFFRQHHYGEPRIQQRLQQIAQALPAIEDQAVLQFAVPAVRVLVRLLDTLRAGIAELDGQIRQLVSTHEDFPIFDSLPGAGPALIPRLIAAFGTHRERYRSAAQMQSYSGIAPVVERSGNKHWTHFRWHCPKFLRQTFHEWAGCSIRFSDWARTFYEQRRAQGQSHHAAVRALAFKWIRIAFRCWKDRTPYEERLYQHARQRRQRPLPTTELRQVELDFQWKTSTGFSKLAALSS